MKSEWKKLHPPHLPIKMVSVILPPINHQISCTLAFRNYQFLKWLILGCLTVTFKNGSVLLWIPLWICAISPLLDYKLLIKLKQLRALASSCSNIESKSSNNTYLNIVKILFLFLRNTNLTESRWQNEYDRITTKTNINNWTWPKLKPTNLHYVQWMIHFRCL